MKENWTKDIHDKMSGMEIDEPAGLWDDICSARKSQAETIVLTPRPQTYRWHWMKRAVSVAAVVAMLLTTGIYLFNINENPAIGETTFAAIDNKPLASANDDNVPMADITSERIEDNIAAFMAESIPEDKSDILPDNQEQKEGVKPVEKTSEKSSEYTVENANEKTIEKPVEKKKKLEEYDPFKEMTLAQVSTPRRSRFSLSVYSNGATKADHRTRYNSAPASAEASSETDAIWRDSPLLGILLLNHGSVCETEFKHHLPIRTGISASYSLSPRLSLESGITFTRLVSDMRDGNDTKYQSGQQKFHYIGIPVSINYELFEWKRLGIYTSAGVLAEQCVSGSQKMEYHINNTTTQQEKKNIGTKPFQMSVNGSVGIAYRLSPIFYIYAGPGISYHFDDGSAIKTIYKEKPLNLNINCGIRINLNK